jgi:hypothetical protein
MRKWKLNLINTFRVIIATVIPILAQAAQTSPIQGQVAQTNRIAPILIDQWFWSRIWIVLIIGVLMGAFEAGVRMPALLPVPHEDDNRRAMKHFQLALFLALLLLLLLWIIDMLLPHRFGSRNYPFLEIISQIGLSWQAPVLLVLGLLAFFATVALWTRLSDKCYRYAFIRG